MTTAPALHASKTAQIHPYKTMKHELFHFFSYVLALLCIAPVLGIVNYGTFIRRDRVKSVRLSATEEGPVVELLVPSQSADFHAVCVSAGESWRSDWLAVAYVMCRHQGEATFRRLDRTGVSHDLRNMSFVLDGYCLGNEQALDQCIWKSVTLITTCTTYLSVSCGECVYAVQLEIGQTTHITSPGYPDQYLYLVTCKWTIQSPEDTVIQIDVLVWNLPGKSDTCNHYMDMYSVQSLSDHVVRLCSSDNQSYQKSYKSVSNVVTVTLHSGHLVPDLHSRKLGFSMQAKAITANTVRDVWFLFKTLVILFVLIGIVVVLLVCYCCMRNRRKRQENGRYSVCCPLMFKVNRNSQSRDTSTEGSECSVHTSTKFPSNNIPEEPDSDGSYLSPLSSETIRSANASKNPSTLPPLVHFEQSQPESAHQVADENEYDIIYTTMDKCISSSQPTDIGATSFCATQDKPFHSLLNLKLAAKKRPPPPLPVFPKHFAEPSVRPKELKVPMGNVPMSRLNPHTYDSSSMPQLPHMAMGTLVFPRNHALSALVLPVGHPQPEKSSWTDHDPQIQVYQSSSPTANEDDRGNLRRPQAFPWMTKVGFRQQRKSRSSGIPLMDMPSQ